MIPSLEVKKDLHWVGTLDFDIRVFDIVMYTKYGTTYNSYVCKGTEKTALIEIAKEKFWDQFATRLESVCDPKEIDYVIVNHTEPDHTGSLVYLLEKNPNLTIVGTATAIRFITQITNKTFNSITVKDGDTLDLGGRVLKFIIAPFLHWPDSMFTYLESEKLLFSCDFLGCHYCSEEMFNDLVTEDLSDAFEYYYQCIMSPFKSHVLSALEKIKGLDIETICTGHGPILRKDIPQLMNLYEQWSNEAKPERPLVVIPYVTSYGYTRKMAEKIKAGLLECQKIDVVMYDLVETDLDVVMADVHKASGLIVGSPTLVGDTLPPVWALLASLNPIIHKGLWVGAFGSYGWSGEAVANIEGRFQQLRLKKPLDSIRVIFNPTDADLEVLYDYGKSFAGYVVES